MKTDLILKRNKEEDSEKSKFSVPTIPFRLNSVSMKSDVNSCTSEEELNKNIVARRTSEYIRKTSRNCCVPLEKLSESRENFKSKVAKSTILYAVHYTSTNRNTRPYKHSKINFRTTAKLRKINLNSELRSLIKSDATRIIEPVVTDTLKPNSEVKSKVSKSEIRKDDNKEAIFPSLSSKIKITRPFKAYPEDPLTVMIGVDTAKLNLSESESYSEFRSRMLDEKRSKVNAINKNMKRGQVPKKMDSAYLEKRKKNNIAAKRSRDARKAKEDELAIRCAYLEQENKFLRAKILEIKTIATSEIEN